ncbi:MAG: hypothetical protein KGO49_13225 [Gammaproteobacteria bacterium]|nr:hypothetical protein [Gammaproteobacteria bacterium]
MDAIEHHLPKANIYIIRQYVKDTEGVLEYFRVHLNWTREGSPKNPEYCSMGVDYLASSGKLRVGQKFDSLILKLMNQINDTLHVIMNSCFAMFYGPDVELPYRRVTTSSLDPDQPILTIFYGDPSIVKLKDIDSLEEFDFLLEEGDLFIMPERCQQSYLTAIVKANQNTSSRLSLTFRRFNDGVFY